MLDMGPFITAGCHWIIKSVPKYYSFMDSCFSKVSIWVNFHKLPKQCLSKMALSKIGSQSGTPIATDMITAQRKFHDCARILVEVDISHPPIEQVAIKMPNEAMWNQPVEYEIKPVVY